LHFSGWASFGGSDAGRAQVYFRQA